MGFLVLLATVQLWDILRHNAQFQVISKTLNKAWDEVVGFILLIVILLSSYAMTVSPKAQPLPQVQSPACALRKHHCSENHQVSSGFLEKSSVRKAGFSHVPYLMSFFKEFFWPGG